MNPADVPATAGFTIRSMSDHPLSQQRGWRPSAKDHHHHWKPHRDAETYFTTRGTDPLELFTADFLGTEISGAIRGLKRFPIEGEIHVSFSHSHGLQFSEHLIGYASDELPADKLASELRTALSLLREKVNLLATTPGIEFLEMYRRYTLHQDSRPNRLVMAPPH